eukprot:TRINITY_DN9675_c0_g1_i3.p1 TRINITY_DN9675_c0_g1~~TRINITY_DN9675_c0_g1_i3.p1  ORF type:complete len:368 (+),score=137.91 TRINITY_DN9675_c0_g1_i3:399-1502(+)
MNEQVRLRMNSLQVSIMTHSMGCRVLMGTCWYFDEVFQPRAGAAALGATTAKAPLQLQTVSLLNPDFEEEEFTRTNGTFSQINRFCSVVTVYADNHDTALLAGSIVNRRPSLGRATHGLKRSYTSDPDPTSAVTPPAPEDADAAADLEAATETAPAPASTALPPPPPPLPLLRRRTSATRSVSSSSSSAQNLDGILRLENLAPAATRAETANMQLLNRLLMSDMRRASVWSSGDGKADMLNAPGKEEALHASGAVRAVRRTSLHVSTVTSTWHDAHEDSKQTRKGSARGAPAPPPPDWLDVDVIDTTWLENNIHSMRHSFYNLNSTIVDDLRDLLVHKRRAEMRPQVTHKFNNVYTYMVAPNIMKNP